MTKQPKSIGNALENTIIAARGSWSRLLNKGETLLDTMTTINSMSPDVLIVRHPEEDISKKIYESDC